MKTPVCDGFDREHAWLPWQLVVLTEQTQSVHSAMISPCTHYEPVTTTDIKTTMQSVRVCSRCGERETK